MLVQASFLIYCLGLLLPWPFIALALIALAFSGVLPWGFALTFCLEVLPWGFALTFCLGVLPWRFALAFCLGVLPWRFLLWHFALAFFALVFYLVLPWRFALVLCLGVLPWRFALAFCLGVLPWRFALVFCLGILPWRFSLAFFLGMFCLGVFVFRQQRGSPVRHFSHRPSLVFCVVSSLAKYSARCFGIGFLDVCWPLPCIVSLRTVS